MSYEEFFNSHMQKELLMKKLNPFSLPLLLVMCLALFGCETGQVKKETKSETASSGAAGQNQAGLQAGFDSDGGKACEDDIGCLRTVNFAFDSSALDQKAQDILNSNAEFLKNVNLGKYKVMVEGHCDERGSIQYNLALGERRANSVKNYLIAKGVDANNLDIISYGKERELATGHDEGAWSKNRRANFKVVE